MSPTWTSSTAARPTRTCRPPPTWRSSWCRSARRSPGRSTRRCGPRAGAARRAGRWPGTEVDREIKRGPGGLRDIEFAVQLLQLVHGRGDETLRTPGTLTAVDALVAGGYVGRDDGVALLAAYRFLRTVEHRLQLQKLR